MKVLAFLLFIISFTLRLGAQNKTNEFIQVDKNALQIPASKTRTTTNIADYIKSHFSSQTDRARAIFIWIACHIEYNMEDVPAVNYDQNTDELADELLKTRKGVCMHYAWLFSSIANKAGIKTYVVFGYTKQNETVDYLPHSWCACLIDSHWYLFDPTWGSGYIQNSTFVKHVNDYYFKARPEMLIHSHIPFDPLWQFLYYPVTNQEFYNGQTAIDKKKPFFNYPDTLKLFEQESETEKLVSANRRIAQNGLKNSMIIDKLQFNQRIIDYYQKKKQVEAYNAAVYSYNKGISQLNGFIAYRNKKFTPQKPDDEIKEMVAITEKSLADSYNKLEEIKNPDSDMTKVIYQLHRSIDEALSTLGQQKAFLNDYFNRGRTSR